MMSATKTMTVAADAGALRELEPNELAAVDGGVLDCFPWLTELERGIYGSAAGSRGGPLHSSL
jgi:hypothetical protein